MSRNRNKSTTKKGESEVQDMYNDKRKTRPQGRKRRTGIPKEDKPGNDPAWYAADPNILRDAASYPFSYSTGATEIHEASAWANTDFELIPGEQVPGVCSLHVYPTIGGANNATDPINVASQSVYSFVRHANSGHANYDAPDLMLYILAMANMYSFLVWCQRLYGYALTYDQRNRYLPNDLIRTNNVDPVDLVNNLSNFRFWINTLIAKMASFAVPATMSIFSRMSFIYSDYYIEGTSIKDQVYQFVPEGFYQFGIDSNQLGELSWQAFTYGTLMSVNDIITYGNNLFGAIWSQEDFGIMSGDILKAYGDRIIKLVSLPEYYNITPKFDPMVLTQMKNADIRRLTPSRIAQSTTDSILLQIIVPDGFTTSEKYYGTSVSLTSTNVLIANAVMRATLADYHILTVDTDAPNPDVVIEATRLKVGYNTSKLWYACGSEVITKLVVTSKPGTDIVIPGIIIGFTNSPNDDDNLSDSAIMAAEEACRNFHYIPRLWKAIINRKTGDKALITQNFDIDNFTLLDYNDVKKLHEAAIINMYAVPSIGRVQ